MGVESTGEFDLIREIRRRVSGLSAVRLGIGDDCAVIEESTNGDWIVTTDMMMDGRHFVLEECGPVAVGVKAMGVNLSDIAAMAGEPVAAFTSVALPRSRARETAMGLMEGMTRMATEYGVALAGGDTNAWDGPLVVNVTLMGRVERGGEVRRSGARIGDSVFVTGKLGGSLLGRHLSPVPRVREAAALRRVVDLHAMIDLSDGLSSDLRHILEESGGLGATIDAGGVPIHSDSRLASERDGKSPLEHALGDGEDFELCFTVGPEDAERLVAHPPGGVVVHRIGTIEREPGVRLRTEDGKLVPMEVAGFDHLRGG